MDNLTPQQLVEQAIAAITTERGAYDSADGDRHRVALMAASFLSALYPELELGTESEAVDFIYAVMLCMKFARLIVIADKGAVHIDSVLDLGGYAWLAADNQREASHE